MARPQLPKSRETVAKILIAARGVLATEGYAGLTMRAVAGKVGLSVGNLAYHFPSKRVLVRGLIMNTLESYQTKSNTFLRSAQSQPGGGLAELVRWLIADAVSGESSRLFRELWTMALHDRVIATEMNRFYLTAHETIAALLVDSVPGLDPNRARDIVQIIGAISEGANVLYSTAAVSDAGLRRFSDLAVHLIVGATQAPRDRKPPASRSTRGSKSPER